MVRLFFLMTLAVSILWPPAGGLAADRALEISIDEIFKAYSEDPQAANQRFRRRALKITGGFATYFSTDHLAVVSRTWQPPRQYQGPNRISFYYGPEDYKDVVEAVKKMVRGESVSLNCRLAEAPGLKGFRELETATCSFQR